MKEQVVLTIVDGDTIHRIAHDEVRFVTFDYDPLSGPAHVEYQLVNQQPRRIRMTAGVGGITGHEIVKLIGCGATGILTRASDTMAFEYTAPRQTL